MGSRPAHSLSSPPWPVPDLGECISQGLEGKSPHRRERIYNGFRTDGPSADDGDCNIERTS